MRTIDGDELKRRAQRVATESWKMRIRASVETTLNQFIDWIDEAPTVDAVPVVRCKDCDSAECSGVMIYCLTHGCYMRDNDFCNYGKRKDGEQQ